MFFDIIILQHFLTPAIPLMQQWPSDQYQEMQCEVFVFCVSHMSQVAVSCLIALASLNFILVVIE